MCSTPHLVFRQHRETLVYSGGTTVELTFPAWGAFKKALPSTTSTTTTRRQTRCRARRAVTKYPSLRRNQTRFAVDSAAPKILSPAPVPTCPDPGQNTANTPWNAYGFASTSGCGSLAKDRRAREWPDRERCALHRAGISYGRENMPGPSLSRIPRRQASE